LRSWARTRKPNKSLKSMVGTTKKSPYTNCLGWFSRNVRQVCEGGFRGLTMYLETVDWDMSMPSLSSSPCTRGAPQVGLEMHIFRMSSLTSRSVSGRPGPRLFQRQKRRKPRRCHQSLLTFALLAALVVVVVGSLGGEAASY